MHYSMKDLIEKENLIFEILQKFIDSGLEFVIVGGYAISAFQHRFSIDADIVVQSKDLEKFESMLRKEGFSKTTEKSLENMYSSRFMRYEKDRASVDLFIDALASQTTSASFSYSLLFSNSTKRKMIGIEKEITARIPSKELLIVLKVHSGRLTDIRDIAALARATNLETMRKFLFIGNLKALQKNLDKLAGVVKHKNFRDSFKGVFREKKFDIDIHQVERIAKLTQYRKANPVIALLSHLQFSSPSG